MESRLVPAVCARLLAVLCAMLVPATATAQRTVGQLRIEVRDVAGSPVDASGTLESDATQVRRAFDIDSTGVYVAIDLPFGVYRVEILRAGFERSVSAVDVRSALPVAHVVTLTLAGFRTAVNVTAAPATILDPFRGAAANSIGADLLRDRPSAAPGRSLIDLINTQPGVLLEANGVLHARGSEYQVQYVIDGIPLRDNRSPAFAQSLGIDEFESMTVRTGGYPAEFGAKLGAVIEVSTARDPRTGLHGTASLEAGSFATLNAYASGSVLDRPDRRRLRRRAHDDGPVSGSAERGQLHQPWRSVRRVGTVRARVDRRHPHARVRLPPPQHVPGPQRGAAAGGGSASGAHGRRNARTGGSPAGALTHRAAQRAHDGARQRRHADRQRVIDSDQAVPGPHRARAARQWQHLGASRPLTS